MTINYSVEAQYIPAQTKRRSGRPMNPGVRFVVAHDTGNPGSSASANVRYYIRTARESVVAAHIFVDDRQIIECVPALLDTPERANHVRNGPSHDNHRFGHDANDASIAVEYCHGGSIDADEAYRRYVWVLAECCRVYQLNPRHHIAGHFELDPSRRTDPVSGLAASQRSFDQLIRDVASLHTKFLGAEPTTPSSGKAITRVNLRVRSGGASRLFPTSRLLTTGTEIDYAEIVEGETVLGNDQWLSLGNDEFVWSGGVNF